MSYDDIFSQATIPNRQKVLVFVTDGNPTRGQEPCSLAQQYADADIYIMAIGVGSLVNPETLPCLIAEDNGETHLLADWGDVVSRMERFFQTEVCDDDFDHTPYDGVYSRRGSNTFGGQPVYYHSQNWMIVYNAVGRTWRFTDPSGVLEDMINSPTIFTDEVFDFFDKSTCIHERPSF